MMRMLGPDGRIGHAEIKIGESHVKYEQRLGLLFEGRGREGALSLAPPIENTR
jgi:hypothetical protein